MMAAPKSENALDDLERDRAQLNRASTAERVAGVLRARILEGYFAPGDRLSEESIAGALAVSRNTLREAFRLLSHERLVVHELNRGVFVRVLALADIVDLYRLRRIVELAAVHGSASADLAGVGAAVERGEAAAAAEDWSTVATADLQFHQELTAMAGSRRLDEMMHRALAELRLAFHVMASSHEFHEPYLRRNREILTLLENGDRRGAERELKSYLDEAERQLLDATVWDLDDTQPKEPQGRR
jgi:DNA-binding GntR family transcriptional regulator